MRKNSKDNNKSSNEWKKRNPEKVKEYSKVREQNKRNYIKIKNNPKEMFKVKIRQRAYKKISIKGVICMKCKKKPAKHRHHPNYNKPFKVILVCAECHRKIHARNNSWTK